MKKIKKLFTLIILLSGIFALVSCQTTNKTPAPDPLNVRIEGTSIKWDSALENETLSYEVSFDYDGKTNYVIVNGLSYNFSKYSEAEEITFTVKTEAFGEYGQNSEGISVTYRNGVVNSKKAPAPTNLKINGTTLSWDSAVEGKTLQYVISLDIDGTTKSLTYLGESYNFSIYANAKKIVFNVSTKAFDDYTENSDSATFTYVNSNPNVDTIAPAPSNLKISGTTLSWDSAVANKTLTYEITMSIDGAKQTVTVTSNSYDFSKYSSAKEINFSIVTKAFEGYTLNSNPVTTKYTNTSSDDELDIYNEVYYKSVLNLSGNALKTALRQLITSTHTYKSSYDDCKSQSKVTKTDGDPNKSGNIVMFYTGKSIKFVWDGGNTWNREHVWPQSLGWFKTSDAGADLHHIRPSEPGVNSSRGNKRYGSVTNSNYYLPNNVNGCGLDYRGDAARIIFYLKLRYTEADSYSWTSVAQSLDLLLEWNRLDPVDEMELARNDAIEDIQGNRNPFIDCPEWADIIW